MRPASRSPAPPACVTRRGIFPLNGHSKGEVGSKKERKQTTQGTSPNRHAFLVLSWKAPAASSRRSDTLTHTYMPPAPFAWVEQPPLPGSPAAEAGLQQGDGIVSIGVADSVDAVPSQIREGQPVTFVVISPVATPLATFDNINGLAASAILSAAASRPLRSILV